MSSLLAWDRRSFLQASLAAGGAAVLSTGDRLWAADSAREEDGMIDAHSHIWTRDIQRFPLAGKTTLDDLKPASFTIEELLATARPLGVTRVVLIQHHLFHGWDNSYLIHAAKTHPDTFRVVGMVDDSAPHPDMKMRELLDEHVVSFRITPWIRGDEKWLDNDGMRLMWRTAADTGQVMGCLIDAKNLAQVDAMCRRFPDTPVVIDHFARIGVNGEIRKADVDQLCALAKHKHTAVKVSAYYALGKKQPPYTDLLPMIRQVLDAFGPERTMWASDSPYQMTGDNTYAASLALIREQADFLSDSDRDWLLRKTAARIYRFA
ncbi:MAG: amidohydrolase family protein [Planctomycetales bacterium]|nr:amidohydrolase family protein [Planctomycetales bacterium]